MHYDYYSIFAAFNRAYTLTDYSIHDNLDKRFEFRKDTILKDESLTKDEMQKAIELLRTRHDYDKIISNEGTRRICENCNQECLATLYCEYCIRNYLKANFSNWTSKNKDIDDLIQECQMKSIGPNKIIEWIPPENLQTFDYLTKGGFSEIWLTFWIEGHYNEWDSKEQRLNRKGKEKVIIKKLGNIASADRRWFEEAKSHLTISNKWAGIVQCYGISQCPYDQDYLLIMKELDTDLRKYLQQNHDQLTWKERIKIVVDIIDALLRIHKENAIHRDLHSGNILYLKDNNYWYISDLGFCGPANKPLECIYGNLPYIAPEVISGKEYTFKSDIYSIAMLMWEISSGKPPFINYEHDYELAMNIIYGIRPKIVLGTPLEYKELMEKCWDADPSKRPNIDVLWSEIIKLNKSSYQNLPSVQNESNESSNFLCINTSKLFTSKLHKFENLPEPKNATEEEQEAFHSKAYSFNIPENINDITSNSISENINISKPPRSVTEVNGSDKSGSNQNVNHKSRTMFENIPKSRNGTEVNSLDKSRSNQDINHKSSSSNIFKRIYKGLLLLFKKQKTNKNQNNLNREMKVQMNHTNDDVDEIYNNPNLHSTEQDELEIPDDGF